MYKYLLPIVLIVAQALATQDVLEIAEDAEMEDLKASEGKTATVSLSGTDTTNFFSNAIYVVPILLLIIFLDFAIFGIFSNRSDDLNPVSNFFYHTRRGLGIFSNKSRFRQGHRNRHRFQRSIEMLGPVMEALSAAYKKYEQ